MNERISEYMNETNESTHTMRKCMFRECCMSAQRNNTYHSTTQMNESVRINISTQSKLETKNRTHTHTSFVIFARNSTIAVGQRLQNRNSLNTQTQCNQIQTHTQCNHTTQSNSNTHTRTIKPIKITFNSVHSISNYRHK